VLQESIATQNNEKISKNRLNSLKKHIKSIKMKVLVIHGPNLNLLGSREPDVYGSTSLDEINAGLEQKAKENHIELESFQSNEPSQNFAFQSETSNNGYFFFEK
jgi:hypothetical protein